MDPITAQLRAVLDAYVELILLTPPCEYHRRVPRVTVPLLLPSLILPLAARSAAIFQDEPTVLAVSEPAIVVGDLHGSLFDLLRILYEFGLPPLTSYVVLGSVVDKGEFAAETLFLLLLLKIFYPSHFFLIRGASEFNEPWIHHPEFSSQLLSLYGTSEVIAALMDLFAWLPIAANVMNYAFAVHGGISPLVQSMKQLLGIPRPIVHCHPAIVADLIWSEPSEICSEAVSSPRGIGVLYGIGLVRRFLRRTGCDVIIRSHGYSGITTSLDELVVTVTSATIVPGQTGIEAGIVHITDDLTWEPQILSPLPMIYRDDVLIAPVETTRKRMMSVVCAKAVPRARLQPAPSIGSMLYPRPIVPPQPPRPNPKRKLTKGVAAMSGPLIQRVVLQPRFDPTAFFS
jgi:protein phosphatase